MKQFKYSLAKRGKIICTNCGKKTAVPYIETETGNIIDGAMRCDRELQCSYHKKPDSNETIFIPKYEIVVKETDYIPLQTLEDFYLKDKKHDLITFLSKRFEYKNIHKAKQDYFLSEYYNGETIFWQIDQLERVRGGKIMAYNPETGKRLKDSNGQSQIKWIHKQPYNLKQCLFGLHLTKEDKKKTIAIVESEKTAFIMSIFDPDFLWLACGSLNGFKLEYLAPIKLRKIVAFPDKGCFEIWNETAKKLNEKGFTIEVSDALETEIDCEIGNDIADEYLKL